MKIRLSFLLLFGISTNGYCQNTPAEKVDFEAIKIHLESVYRTDQTLRRKLDRAQKGCGAQSPQVNALWLEISKSDSINLLQVRAILDTWGWLGANKIGASGTETLFAVIQHSDLATQEQYLPLMREAVKAGNAERSNLALLEDRVLISQGKKQLYGSQLTGDPETGGKYVSPLADPDQVDERRAGMGLEPLAGYLNQFNLKWNLEAYKKELPRLEEKQWGKQK